MSGVHSKPLQDQEDHFTTKGCNPASHTFSQRTLVDVSQDVDLIMFPEISSEFP